MLTKKEFCLAYLASQNEEMKNRIKFNPEEAARLSSSVAYCLYHLGVFKDNKAMSQYCESRGGVLYIYTPHEMAAIFRGVNKETGGKPKTLSVKDIISLLPDEDEDDNKPAD